MEQNEYSSFSEGIYYLFLVGSLLYATQTCSDIQFSVNLITQFSRNSGISHFEATKCIICYLKGTQDFSLVLGYYERGAINVIGQTNSDWASDIKTRCSVGGFVFDVARGCISWSSKKQVSVAISSIETEYIVLANVTKEAVWL